MTDEAPRRGRPKELERPVLLQVMIEERQMEIIDRLVVTNKHNSRADLVRVMINNYWAAETE